MENTEIKTTFNANLNKLNKNLERYKKTFQLVA